MNTLKLVCTLACSAAASMAGAATANFTTLTRTTFDLNDSLPVRIFSFTLPSTVYRSTTNANSAILDLEVKGAEYNYAEIYVNPLTNVCTPDGVGDVNQSASIGFVQEHDDGSLRAEWATNHFAFSSELLRAGANVLMVCARSETGDSDPAHGNIDDIAVKNITLHYHTSP